MSDTNKPIEGNEDEQFAQLRADLKNLSKIDAPAGFTEELFAKLEIKEEKKGAPRIFSLFTGRVFITSAAASILVIISALLLWRQTPTEVIDTAISNPPQEIKQYGKADIPAVNQTPAKHIETLVIEKNIARVRPPKPVSSGKGTAKDEPVQQVQSPVMHMEYNASGSPGALTNTAIDVNIKTSVPELGNNEKMKAVDEVQRTITDDQLTSGKSASSSKMDAGVTKKAFIMPLNRGSKLTADTIAKKTPDTLQNNLMLKEKK